MASSSSTSSSTSSKNTKFTGEQLKPLKRPDDMKSAHYWSGTWSSDDYNALTGGRIQCLLLPEQDDVYTAPVVITYDGLYRCGKYAEFQAQINPSNGTKSTQSAEDACIRGVKTDAVSYGRHNIKECEGDLSITVIDRTPTKIRIRYTLSNPSDHGSADLVRGYKPIRLAEPSVVGRAAAGALDAVNWVTGFVTGAGSKRR